MKKIYGRGIAVCAASLFAAGVLFLVGGCSGGRGGQHPKNLSTEYVLTVHPQFRMWNSPCEGMSVGYNPPVLLWPAAKEGNYSVRLSRSEDFPPGKTITDENLPWAFYNPHRKLDQGTWYWQVKCGNGAWSETERFTVDQSAIDFVTPPVGELLTRFDRSRPRVLVRGRELAALRARAQGTRERDAILRDADAFLHAAPPKESEAVYAGRRGEEDFMVNKIANDYSKRVGDRVRIVLENLSQAYILTGDEKYTAPARRWALAAAGYDPAGPTRISDFGDSGCMLGMAYAYDTFYDYFSPAERDRLKTSTAARIAHFYKSWSHKLDTKVLSGHVWQHILHRYTLATLALLGDEPDADRWFAYAYEYFLARAPILGGSDGAWAEGVSYFNMNGETLLDLPSVFAEMAEGVDYIRQPFYANNALWHCYAFPPGSNTDGLYNDSRKWKIPGLEVIGYADALARITQSPYAAWYAARCAEEAGVDPADNANYRWLRLHRGYDRELPAYQADTMSLPNGRTFPDIGVAYMNTNLADRENNIMVSFRSSPYGGYGHMHADHNCFNILAGGRYLFSNSGYRIAMSDPHYLGWFKHTVGHNGILIDGRGQPFTSNGYGWIPRSIHTDRFQYVVGDASNAYDDRFDKRLEPSGLRYFRRHLVLLPPNVVVIYDVLEADRPVEWSLLLHSDNPIRKEEGHRWRTENDRAAGEAILFASQSFSTFVTDTFSVQPVNWRPNKRHNEFPDQWHFRASNDEKTPSMRFLTVIQVGDKGKPIPPPATKSGRIEAGEWLIDADMTSMPGGRLAIHNADGTIAFSSSGGELVDVNGKICQGKIPGSAILLLEKDGNPQLIESADRMPPALEEAARVQLRRPLAAD